MITEKQKMLSGEFYNPADPELEEMRTNARLLLYTFNQTRETELALRLSILDELIPNKQGDLFIQPPFYCDYGTNIQVGAQVHMNFNCVILDEAKVIIGNRTLLGPNVQIYTATHPMSAVQRAEPEELAKPIAIGNDVWVGGGAIICPGVVIGDRTVIGAGSVVTRNIPSDVFAAGNPCRVIRKL